MLRPFTGQDARRLSAILHEEGILRYFPEPTPPPLEVTERSIARRLEHWTQYGYGRWAVIPREMGILAGWCGLDYATELEAPELTYLLSSSVWGRGYASEAARATIRFGFEAVGLDRIMSMAHPDNAASNRVLLKCGLQVHGEILIEGQPMTLYRMDRPATLWCPVDLVLDGRGRMQHPRGEDAHRPAVLGDCCGDEGSTAFTGDQGWKTANHT